MGPVHRPRRQRIQHLGTCLVNSPPHQGLRQKKFCGSRWRQKTLLLSWKHQCHVLCLFSSSEECLTPCVVRRPGSSTNSATQSAGNSSRKGVSNDTISFKSKKVVIEQRMGEDFSWRVHV